MTLALLVAGAGAVQLADSGWWVWLVVVAFWIVVNIVSTLRRGFAQLKDRGVSAEAEAQTAVSDLEQTPQLRSIAAATRQLYEDARSDVVQQTSSLGTESFGAQAADVARDVLTDVRSAKAAATLTVSQARADAALHMAPVAAGQALTATLGSLLDMRAGGLGAVAAVPSSALSFDPAAALRTPSGVTFAIVAATIIGPCVALRDGPMQPGGW